MQFNRAKNNYFFNDAEECDTFYEVTKKPRKFFKIFRFKLLAVFDDSKLQLLVTYQ